MIATALHATPTPTETVILTDFTLTENAFEQVLRNLQHGVIANYRVGLWLERAKQTVPHGYFSPVLEAFAKRNQLSPETLRRRMGWYRLVREGLAKLPYGTAIPADEIDTIVLAEESDEEQIKRTQAAIEAAAMLQTHKAAVKNLAANLRLEGVTEARHKALTKTISRIKAAVDAETFTARIEAFLNTWEKELPPLPVKAKMGTKAATAAEVPAVIPAAVATEAPTTTETQPVVRRSIFAADEDVL